MKKIILVTATIHLLCFKIFLGCREGGPAISIKRNVYGTYHLGSGEGSQGSTPQSGSVHHKRIR
jgi:hypothetical protein